MMASSWDGGFLMWLRPLPLMGFGPLANELLSSGWFPHLQNGGPDGSFSSDEGGL